MKLQVVKKNSKLKEGLIDRLFILISIAFLASVMGIYIARFIYYYAK